jgi:hypothetical protein
LFVVFSLGVPKNQIILLSNRGFIIIISKELLIMGEIVYKNLKFKPTVKESKAGTLDIFGERREIIDWYKERIHILFSKRIVAEGLTIIFLITGIAFSLLGFPYIFIPFSLSVITLVVRFRLAALYRKERRLMNMSVAFMDKKIFQDYNIRM